MNSVDIRARLVVAALLVCLTVTACGLEQSSGEDNGVGDAESCNSVDVSILRQARADYEPFYSLEELYENGSQEVVVSGRIAGFSSGPIVPVSGDPEFPDRHVIMTVKVDTVLAGEKSSPLVHDGFVFVPLLQGPVDSETMEPIHDVAAFEKALPEGTEAVLFLSPAPPKLAELAKETVPGGGSLGAVGPQGLYLDNCGELVGGTDDIPGTAEWEKFTSTEGLEAGVTRLSR